MTSNRDRGVDRENPAVQRKLDAAIQAYQGGDFARALKISEELARRTSPPAMALFLVGAIRFRSGDADDALPPMRRAVELAPDVPLYRSTLATLLDARGMRQEAGEHLAHCVKLAPNDPSTRMVLSEMLRRQGRFDEARTHAEAATRLLPSDPAPWRRLGSVLVDMGLMDEARRAFATALDHAPDDVETLTRHGSLQRSCGDKDAAVATFRRVLELDPANGVANMRLVDMAPEHAADPDTLATLAARDGLPDQQRNQLYIALGNAGEKAGDHARAFAAWRDANRFRARYLGQRFSLEHYTAFVDEAVARFDADWFSMRAGSGVSDETPLFVVGMPRSGTTLIERIIGSHPSAYGAGELPDVTVLRRRVTGSPDDHRFPDSIDALDAARLRACADAYLASVRAMAPGAARVVDKMPHNFEHLWFIALMFPGARVIHARRSPLDTCVSCFQTDFEKSHGYRNDAADLGGYYRQYRRLMDHWTAVCPLTVMDVQYEELVADQEAGSRRMIEFAGLEWDDACLDFTRGGTAVRTASADQVRRGISTRSVGRWLNYREHMQDLIEAIGPELVVESERLAER